MLAPLWQFFGGEAVHGASFATEKPDGFTDQEIAALDLLMPSLTRVIENHTLRRTAGILLETYVGHRAGPRVLAGQIRRGDTAVINAAIWLSDMRGFTELSDRPPPQSLVDLLNRYFDCKVPVIRKHGGEVLKFMGDGLLAIFAISSDGEDERAICEAALAAARETRSLIAASFSAERSCDRSVSFGLALHVGEVMYGNIGSEGRLDFTCIGPAVNLAARIEKLTGELRRSILASDTFARHFSSDFNAVGEFRLRGFGSARTVFGLKDENEATELRGATNS
jgi:adenylate cyclase